MRKLLSLLLAAVLAVGMSAPALAAIDVIELGDESGTGYVDGDGTVVTKTVRDKKDTYKITGVSYPDEAREVLTLTNQERRAAGLPALAWKSSLVQPAIQRALEAYLSWSHTRPNGSAWHTVHSDAKGENLARGDTNAEDVVEGWMNSPEHRTNILDKDYTSMAVACVDTDQGVYWVQLFYYENSEVHSANVGSDGKVDAAKVVSELTSGGGKVKVSNADSVTAAGLKSFADWGAKNTRAVSFTADTTYTGAAGIQGRITLNPAAFTGLTADLKLGCYVESRYVSGVLESFKKWYKNAFACVYIEQNGQLPGAISVACKVSLAGLDTAKLQFWAYDKAANTIVRIEKPEYSIDSAGYLHFKTSRGGYIMISDKALTK